MDVAALRKNTLLAPYLQTNREAVDMTGAQTLRLPDGTLVSREWIVTAVADRVLCSHFLWPPERVGPHPDPDWKDRVYAMMAQPPPDALLNSLAVTAAGILGRDTAWTVRFVCDGKGNWWLVDASPAGQAWHPDCSAVAP